MKKLGMVAVVLSLAACGGNVVRENEGGGGAATSDSQAGGGGAGGSPATATACEVQPTDPNGGWAEPTCDSLGAMVIESPNVVDDGGDGEVAAGEKATVSVQLREITGIGFYAYPEVLFSSDVEGVTVTNDAMLYGIGACDSIEMSTVITVDASVPKGTVVHVGAQVGMLGLECPDAFATSIPILIH